MVRGKVETKPSYYRVLLKFSYIVFYKECLLHNPVYSAIFINVSIKCLSPYRAKLYTTTVPSYGSGSYRGIVTAGCISQKIVEPLRSKTVYLFPKVFPLWNIVIL